MSWSLSPRVDLSNDRIPDEDADRQLRTSREILSRLNTQPGVVLADEVGMGKTFVALAVAASVVEATRRRNPVVVMVPAGVRDKWPRDWRFFHERCLGQGRDIRATESTVDRGLDFLKLLDDPGSQRKHIIFLSHHAFSRSLGDPFVTLAIIRTAFRWQRGMAAERAALSRWAYELVGNRAFRNQPLVDRLLGEPPDRWRTVYRRLTGDDLENEPIPDSLLKAMDTVDLESVRAALRDLPLNRSKYLKKRLQVARAELKRATDEAWKACLTKIKLRLPLLIMDEAHHLKNPHTRLASLLSNKDDLELLRGPLGGAFKRMLFLSATPFQLGHHELIEVLRRFDGVRWENKDAREGFAQQLEEIQRALDTAQAGALRLDRAWSRLASVDVPTDEAWWQRTNLTGTARNVSELARGVESKIRAAEKVLRPWVIRHIRDDREARRSVRSGRSILTDNLDDMRGLQVAGSAVFPFLLAARAQAVVSSETRASGRQTRAFFAEGLASSFEAYRETRRTQNSKEFLDDTSADGHHTLSHEAQWYLEQIDQALPDSDTDIRASHPKVQATVERVADLWQAGEKTLVFCFYRHTGRALRNHVSRVIEARLLRQAADKLNKPLDDPDAVWKELDLYSRRFFDPKSPVTRMAEGEVRNLLKFTGTTNEDDLASAADVVLRFLRTPIFLVRDVDLSSDFTGALESALEKRDASGRSIREKIEQFGQFLESRVASERTEVLAALDRIQTGLIRGQQAGDLEEQASSDRSLLLLPNVRLANGEVRRDTRQRLMLAFNTPFYPEVLIASSVMAEGVDLHLECRHTIHHDLDWNPSVLEQRTGRLDRIGSKAEVTKNPIVVYEPFLEGTQDEKQFRVVKDRERWFNVVMGEKMELDEWSTDRAAERVPLPVELAKQLTMDLEI